MVPQRGAVGYDGRHVGPCCVYWILAQKARSGASVLQWKTMAMFSMLSVCGRNAFGYVVLAMFCLRVDGNHAVLDRQIAQLTRGGSGANVSRLYVYPHPGRSSSARRSPRRPTG